MMSQIIIIFNIHQSIDYMQETVQTLNFSKKVFVKQNTCPVNTKSLDFNRKSFDVN